MATKSKTSESPAPVKEVSLKGMLATALDQFNAGNLKEAQAGFTTLQEEASKVEDFRLARAAQDYLKAIQTRLDSQVASAPLSVELAAQVKLNLHESDAALNLLEEGLKARPTHAGLMYLKAVALAQLDQAQPAADALTQATTADPAFLYQFRLEADFDGVRHSAPFAVFNRG